MRMEAPPVDVAEAGRTRRRYDRIAWLYDACEWPVEQLVHRGLRQKLLAAVPSGARMLEVGAGTGRNLDFYSDGVDAVVTDLSPKMLERAEHRARRLGRQASFQVADAQRLPFGDDSFDAVVASFVFCSVPDPLLGLREVARVPTRRRRVAAGARATSRARCRRSRRPRGSAGPPPVGRARQPPDGRDGRRERASSRVRRDELLDLPKHHRGEVPMTIWGCNMMWFWWIPAIVVVAALFMLLQRGSGRGAAEADAPEQVLKRRYARGEIDRDEYQRKLHDLRGP
jgi:SAM-dependent methyltransferase